MPPEDVVLLPDDLLEGGAPARGLQPAWAELELQPALVEPIVGLPEFGRISAVDQHRNTHLPGLVPDGCNARVVDRDPVAVRVEGGEPEVLENLETRRSVANVLLQLGGRSLTPSRRSHSPEVYVREEHEPAGGVPRHAFETRDKGPSASPREIDHDRHVQLVHLSDEPVRRRPPTCAWPAGGRECRRTESERA